ncbi:MAG TPA: DnaJ domain-containing protein [Synechococcales cyanobacterium M55_K2018_004]|nr:DnaJ domain-containing protein [Synechococcales cyanobacterium M55_K2018_004]
MAEFRQYYVVLGLEPGASQEMIRQAYRQLVKVWHPDRFAHDPDLKYLAEEKIKAINEAYQKLKQLPQAFAVPNSPVSAQTAAAAETVIRRQASSAERFYQEASAHVQANRYREAIEALSAAIRVNPAYIQAYRYRGFIYSLMGLELSAEADLTKAKQLERSPNSSTPSAPPPPHHPSDLRGCGQADAPPPSSHLWRCTQTLLAHPDGINAIALSPDSRILATAGNDALIQLWNMKTSKAFCQLTAHRQAIYTLAFSPNGQVLVSGGADQMLKLWHLPSASLLRSLVGHTGCRTPSKSFSEVTLKFLGHCRGKNLVTRTSYKNIIFNTNANATPTFVYLRLALGRFEVGFDVNPWFNGGHLSGFKVVGGISVGIDSYIVDI